MRDLITAVFVTVLGGALLSACQSDPPEGAAPPPVDATVSVSADTGIAELGVAEIGVVDASPPRTDLGSADTDTGYCPQLGEADECWMGIEPLFTMEPMAFSTMLDKPPALLPGVVLALRSTWPRSK